ncbi:hypothetical protein LIX60_04540 [Streptomyces sp. S07_1.15]|uniref:hypothetical protein n=1 Tax=Streptomyces sp. S07_1.15 TaxID=2873925 RepID=UPI001D137E53|nr:hypothetical protein [Streptomyces sp. S07_1.15]MCC3650757.1 hypothetical protein [Streptomyces sp. S07_1.15]
MRRIAAGALFTGAVLATSPHTANANSAPSIEIASTVGAEAREYANAHPGEMKTMASLCGSSYDVIVRAERLPDETRLGTLWVYSNTSAASNSQNTCALFDNNTGRAMWMKLQLCDNYTTTPCDTDQGTFSQYAGPVWQEPGGCGKVTALMKTSSSSSTYIINRVINNVTACN